MQNRAFTTYSVIDANIVSTSMELALSEVARRGVAGNPGYACFVNAHVSVMTRQDPVLKEAVNSATFAFPDGMPVFLVGRYLQNQENQKISGPDFMQNMFENEKYRQLKHYFYGGKPEILEKLVSVLNGKYPGCNIVGAVSPPFRALTSDEQAADLAAIRDSGAQIVWVGLGAPKQELWMRANSSKLSNAMLMGVGAAFDFQAGIVDRAPEWAQKGGLEWLYRLLQEPGRLWKRYLVTNSLFMFYVFTDWLKKRN